MTKSIASGQRNNQVYKDLVEFFEPIIGYSPINRAKYAYLLNDGFSLECWEQLCNKIAVSDEQFPMLVESIIHQEPKSRIVCILLELLCHIKKEEASVYLYQQVKVHATMDFHSLPKVLFYLGIGDGIKINNLKDWAYPLSLSIIQDAMTRYWEEYDGALKIKTLKGSRLVLKYQNIQIDIGNSSPNPHANEIVQDYSRLKKLVEDINNSKNTVAEIKKIHSALDFMFDKLFEVFIPNKVLNEYEEHLERMIVENTPIVYVNQAYYKVFGSDLYEKLISTKKGILDSKLYKKYESLLQKKMEEQKQRRFTSNLNILRQHKSSFSLLILDQNKIKERTYEVNFNMMPIFTEWAEYMFSLDNKIKIYSILATTSFLNFVMERHPNTSNLSTKDIAQKDLIDFLNEAKISQNSAARAKAFLFNMLDYLIAKKSDGKLPMMGQLPEPPSINISKNIVVERPDIVSNRIPMPEYVFTQIMLHIEELEPTLKNAFELIAAGGLRPNELEGITPESLIEKNGKLVLQIWEYKKEKRKSLKGKKPIREIPLNFTEATEAFRNQVRVSEEARKASGHDSIFIHKLYRRSVYGIVSSDQLHKGINKLIKKYNIINSNTGDQWHYTPYQLRVSLVVEMIENGACDSQIKAFFGWNSESTIRGAYYMTRKLKLMEMDTEFFMREFAVNLSKEAIEQYGEDELNEIVMMFYVTSREMAYGRCIRHPSQGICGKLHEASACAPCNNLKVSPHYRKKWEDLYSLQFSELKKLRLYYEQREIVEKQYVKHEFYIVQAGILESYANVLMNIDKPSIIKVVKWHE